MANKHQVLKLLAKGFNSIEVAKRLGCSDGYVRATRMRATPEGREKSNKWNRERERRIRAQQRRFA